MNEDRQVRRASIDVTKTGIVRSVTSFDRVDDEGRRVRRYWLDFQFAGVAGSGLTIDTSELRGDLVGRRVRLSITLEPGEVPR